MAAEMDVPVVRLEVSKRKIPLANPFQRSLVADDRM